MSIKTTTTDDLRRMKGKEGLVLQGCGGDPQEWVDGINDLLTKEGILLNGSKFENCSVFKHDDLTCILYPFEGTELNIGKFAVWRLATHDNFGGTWLSDYVPNRLGGFEGEIPDEDCDEGMGINRLDFGKKYCHNSPTVEESILQRAVMRAIMETAQQNLGVLQTLKVHIGMGLQSEQTEDNSMELQIRIAEIDAEFKAMLAKISTDTVDAFDEEKAKRLMDEKARLQQQLGNIRDGQLKREQTQSRLDDIYTILDGLKNRPMEYDEQIVRQLLECITVDSKEQITVIFVGGLKVVQPLID